MKNQTLRASLLSVPLLLALNGAGERVGYQPKDGLSVSKKVEIQSDVALDEMTTTMDGQDLGSMMEMGCSARSTRSRRARSSR
jgi:hypothetical protein